MKYLSALILFFVLSPAQAAIDHIVIVMFENSSHATAIAQKNFRAFAERGMYLANMHGEDHPSQPNYIALVSGSRQGVRNDKSYDIKAPTIAELIEAKGLTWRTYAEGYPGNCFAGNKGLYVRKHNPLISFPKVRAQSCANFVNADKFGTEPLPNLTYYIPNLENDGHNTGVAYADAWFGRTFMPLLNNPAFMNNTLLIVTFDEDDGTPQNQIYTALVGAMVKPSVNRTAHNHYSILKLIEDNWGLGNLGRGDAAAKSIF